MFKKLNWGHGVAIALASFIAFILFMILVFPDGQKNSDLVSKDYYEDELAYQQVIDAKKNAEQLDTHPEFKQTAEGIRLTFPAPIQPDGKKVDFVLYRTDDANLDIKKQEFLDGANSMLIPAKVLYKGSYTLKMMWQKEKKPFQLDYDVTWN